MQTFLVRVWTPGDGEEPQPGELHGILEGAGISTPIAFRRDEELLAALRARLQAAQSQVEPEKGAVR